MERLDPKLMESLSNKLCNTFFRSLNVEAISRDRYQTGDELTWAVKKYIHFYNTKRIHSANGAMTPNQFEQFFLKQAKALS